jgi:hypothetical protein
MDKIKVYKKNNKDIFINKRTFENIVLDYNYDFVNNFSRHVGLMKFEDDKEIDCGTIAPIALVKRDDLFRDFFNKKYFKLLSEENKGKYLKELEKNGMSFDLEPKSIFDLEF